MHNHTDMEDWVNEFCPQCEIGRIKATGKPYTKIFHNKLFTIPSALCYQCDICNYYEFDSSIFEIISDMVFRATRHTMTDAHTSSIPTQQGNDLKRSQKPPQF